RQHVRGRYSSKNDEKLRGRLSVLVGLWFVTEASGVSGNQSKDPPCIGSRRDIITQNLNDLCCLFDQRRIARSELTPFQIDVVLKSNSRMSTKQNCLSHHGELMQRNAEGEPRGVRRQQTSHVGHCVGGCRLTPGNSQANLEHTRRLDVAIF